MLQSKYMSCSSAKTLLDEINSPPITISAMMQVADRLFKTHNLR